MTQIHVPGEAVLELRAHGRVERLPLQLVREARPLLDIWVSSKKSDLVVILDRWLAPGGECAVLKDDVDTCARLLAEAAHEVTSEEGVYGRLLPATRGRIFGDRIDQVSISVLAVLSLALQRFALVGGLGAQIIRPGLVEV